MQQSRAQEKTGKDILILKQFIAKAVGTVGNFPVTFGHDMTGHVRPCMSWYKCK